MYYNDLKEFVTPMVVPRYRVFRDRAVPGSGPIRVEKNVDVISTIRNLAFSLLFTFLLTWSIFRQWLYQWYSTTIVVTTFDAVRTGIRLIQSKLIRSDAWLCLHSCKSTSPNLSRRVKRLYMEAIAYPDTEYLHFKIKGKINSCYVNCFLS